MDLKADENNVIWVKAQLIDLSLINHKGYSFSCLINAINRFVQ